MQSFHGASVFQDLDTGGDCHLRNLFFAYHPDLTIGQPEQILWTLSEVIINPQHHFTGGIARLDEKFLEPPVLRGVQEQTGGGISVPPGPATLLVIGFYASWKGVMDDHSNI